MGCVSGQCRAGVGCVLRVPLNSTCLFPQRSRDGFSAGSGESALSPFSAACWEQSCSGKPCLSLPGITLPVLCIMWPGPGTSHSQNTDASEAEGSDNERESLAPSPSPALSPLAWMERDQGRGRQPLA